MTQPINATMDPPLNPSSTNVLITGGTGFVGKAVLARLVDQPWVGRIYLLVRGKRGSSADERVQDIVKKMFPKGRLDALLEKIRAVPGDLTEVMCGIPKHAVEVLKTEVHQLLHVGASTDFGAPLAESRLSNVEGTRHALDLAVLLKEQGMLRRFDYVSTAYVAGKLEGKVSECDLDRSQDFANNYEQSKFEAELLVRDYFTRLDIAIYRPSIVVGDSRNGYTPHFKVLYWPLLLLSKNLLPFFACNQRAYLDVVPVDYVADGIVCLMQKDASLGETFHLTAGLGNEVRVKQFLRDAYHIAGIQKRPIIPFWLFNLIANTPLRRRYAEHFWDAVDLAKPYQAYLRGTGVRFDSTKSLATLADLGVQPPKWESYKREVLSFCLTSKWGRKLPLPEYAYYLPLSTRRGVYQPGKEPQIAFGQPNYQVS